MRLFGIDAPEMPGACRPGRNCTPGDPYAARDYLASLTAGRKVLCEERDIDAYGRRVVDCAADGINLGCQMVADGYAVERYGRLMCESPMVAMAPEPRQRSEQAEDPAESAKAPAVVFYKPVEATAFNSFSTQFLRIAALWLLVINIAAFAAFAVDKRRAVNAAKRRVRRIPETSLLLMAALGGSIGAITAQQKLRHKTYKQPFATRLLFIAGIQLGVTAGLIMLTVLP